MAVRTREKLIEVAKQVFMQKGVENTTIADIANASDKGRRTIYTYFKNKLELYTAVIERESDRMVGALRDIAEGVADPAEKLRQFLVLRVSPSMNTTSPHSALKSLLSMDFGRTEKARKKASEKEVQMLDAILDEGVARGRFDAAKAERMRTVLYTLIRSIDLMSVNDDVPQPAPMFPESFASFIADSLCLQPLNCGK